MAFLEGPIVYIVLTACMERPVWIYAHIYLMVAYLIR